MINYSSQESSKSLEISEIKFHLSTTSKIYLTWANLFNTKEVKQKTIVKVFPLNTSSINRATRVDSITYKAAEKETGREIHDLVRLYF